MIICKDLLSVTENHILGGLAANIPESYIMSSKIYDNDHVENFIIAMFKWSKFRP